MKQTLLFFILIANNVLGTSILDSKKNLKVKTDSLTFTKDKNVATLSKNVKVKGNDFDLYADKMLVYYDNGKRIERIFAEKNVKFLHKNTEVRSNEGIYDIKNNLITSQKNVEAFEDGITMKADKFIYDISTKKTEIFGGKESKAKIILD
jgi:lipopolysaccharide transport protein LptA